MHDEFDANYFAFKALEILKNKEIKIENPNDPDYTRNFPPFTKSDNESAFFAQYNRNKLGMTIDLKSEDRITDKFNSLLDEDNINNDPAVKRAVDRLEDYENNFKSLICEVGF